MRSAFTQNRRSFLATCLGAGATLRAYGTDKKESEMKVSERQLDEERKAIRKAWLDLLGPFPEAKPALKPEQERVEDVQGLECRHVTFQSEPDDRVPGLLLLPKRIEGKSPAILCIHPTTHGAGKRLVTGLSGRASDEPALTPEQGGAYALELARWGYLPLSIDLVCDGERIPPGEIRYDTRWFYQRHPEWSAVGKNIWDVMRAVDFLHTLDFIDTSRIACIGHSLGGHTSLFASAFEPRIAAAVCNGGVYSWVRDEEHWYRFEKEPRAPVDSYVYIKRFRPYLEDRGKPVPADFDGLMTLCAPRPLLLMQTESEFKRDDTATKAARAAETYRFLDAGDRITTFTYPGEHNYPPVAKRFSFAWLDRWFHHTPAVPSIWPNQVL